MKPLLNRTGKVQAAALRAAAQSTGKFSSSQVSPSGRSGNEGYRAAMTVTRGRIAIRSARNPSSQPGLRVESSLSRGRSA